MVRNQEAASMGETEQPVEERVSYPPKETENPQIQRYFVQGAWPSQIVWKLMHAGYLSIEQKKKDQQNNESTRNKNNESH